MKNSSLILFSVILLLLLNGCTNDTINDNRVPITQNQNQSVDKTPAPTTTTTAPANGPDHSANASTTGASGTKASTLSWYFVRNDQHQYPDTNADYKEMLTQNQAIYIIPNESKRIYLTFDCGYELGYTGQILDALKARGVKAAFFITGQYIKTQPDLVKRMQAEGHLVCNHSYNHPDFSTINQSKLQEEITSLEDSYRSVTGLEMNKIAVDPGIGFGKNIEQNLRLIKNIKAFKNLGSPILLGVSRKGFIGRILDTEVTERLEGSLGVTAWGAIKGVDIIRVHDVQETVRVVKILEAIQRVGGAYEEQ